MKENVLSFKQREGISAESTRIAIVSGARDVAKNIATIREDKISAALKKDRIAEKIVQHLGQHGTFATDRNSASANSGTALYCHESGHLYNVSKKDELFSAFIQENYQLNYASSEFNSVIASMKHSCIQNNTTNVYQNYHYNITDNTLYIPVSRNEMLRCDENGINMVVNGDNGIFFKISDSFSPFNYDNNIVNSNESTIRKILFTGLSFLEDSNVYLDKREASFLLELSLYFIPFSQSMTTRPIIIVHGQRGSGKSTLMKKIGIALFGSKFRLSLIPRTRRDLETELANNHLCIFDNVDRDIKASLRDALAAVATGTGFRARKLYTNADQCSFSPLPVVSITTRNPAFSEKDDDILNRALIIRLLPMDDMIPENRIIEGVINSRDFILNEMVSKMPAILKSLPKEAPIKKVTGFRIADFQEFALKAAFPIFGDTYNEDEISALLHKCFAKLEASQHDYLMGNPFFHVIDAFVLGLKKQDDLVKKDNESNVPKEDSLTLKISTSDLFKKLMELDKDLRFGFSKVCKSVISLGKLMSNNQAILKYRYNYKFDRENGNTPVHFFNAPKDGPIEI